MANPEGRVIAEFIAKQTDRVKQLKEGLATGSASDYADYRYVCGQIYEIEEGILDFEAIRKRVLEGK